MAQNIHPVHCMDCKSFVHFGPTEGSTTICDLCLTRRYPEEQGASSVPPAEKCQSADKEEVHGGLRSETPRDA